jgi:hypothetical protein
VFGVGYRLDRLDAAIPASTLNGTPTSA